jgi:hypothetical protein
MSGEGLPSEYLGELARVTNRTAEQVAEDRRIVEANLADQQTEQSTEIASEDRTLVYPIVSLLRYDLEDASDTN